MHHMFDFYFLRQMVEDFYDEEWSSDYEYSSSDLDAIALKINDFVTDAYYFENTNGKSIAEALSSVINDYLSLPNEFWAFEKSIEDEEW